MTKKHIKISPSSTINIERCNGRISLQGSSKEFFSYSSSHSVSVFEEYDAMLKVFAAHDLKAYVPQRTPVQIQQVDGRLSVKELRSLYVEEAGSDVKISDLGGRLTVGSVRGDLEVKNVAGLSATMIGGDVSGKEISGDIKIGTIRDGLSLRSCSQKIEVSRIHGDVFLNQITGVVKLDSVEGDVILQGPLVAEKHHIIAAGDVIIYWPEDRKVQFLISHKGLIRNQLGFSNETKLPGEFQATIGDDSCKLIIEAGGDVHLRPLQSEKKKTRNVKKPQKRDDFDIDLEDLLDPEELLEKIGDGIKSMMMLQKRKKGKGLLGKIFGKAMQEVDEWAGVPQERDRRGQGNQSQSSNGEEERRIILKMLENGSITVDEAAERLKKLS